MLSRRARAAVSLRGPSAISTMRCQRSGERTTRRKTGKRRSSRKRAIAPLAAIMKSSMISLARFRFSAASPLTAPPSNWVRTSTVSSSSARARDGGP